MLTRIYLNKSDYSRALKAADDTIALLDKNELPARLNQSKSSTDGSIGDAQKETRQEVDTVLSIRA